MNDNEIFDMTLELVKRQQQMLTDKQLIVLDLLSTCPDDGSRKMVYNLLINFSEMNEEIYNLALIEIKNHIISKKIPYVNIGIIATSIDSEPDSSQEIAQSFKLTWALDDNPPISIKNSFNARNTLINKEKKTHIFLIDDFIGSGKTCRSRYNVLKNEFKHITDLHIHFCFIAGMQHAIKTLQEEGIDIYCAYTMKKGITESYSNPQDIAIHIAQMKKLESSLAPQINDTLLSEHTLGYGMAEALFCRRYQNIPNNVFPIFWWKKDLNATKRNTLYTRVQNGY